MTLEKVAYSVHDKVHPNVAEHFGGYPLERLWYLLFDYNRRFMGPAGFDKPSTGTLRKLGEQGERENETNYLLGMFSGFNYILATIDKPLSLDYLEALHDAAVSKTQYNRPGIQTHERGYRLCDNPITVGLIASGLRRNVTQEGLKELRNRIRGGDDYFRILFKDDLAQISTEFFYSYNPNIPEDLGKANIDDQKFYEQICEQKDAYTVRFICPQHKMLNRLNDIMLGFNKYIMTPGISEDEKIAAIAKCVQDILLTHPFADGNGRTTSLLLNKLLLQHNLSPTIIENPTMIDAFSITELCKEIKKGQDVFRAQENICIEFIAQKTEDSVMYLKDNPHVAALLVYSATTPIFIWDEINISDRKLAVDLLINDLCANSPTLTAEKIKKEEKEINNNVTLAIYRVSP